MREEIWNVESQCLRHDRFRKPRISQSYDLINRLTSISHEDSQLSTLASFDYGYSAANQRTNVTHADDSYWTYASDSLGQVVSGKQRGDQDALLGRVNIKVDAFYYIFV